MKAFYIRTPGDKCIALDNENIIISVGSIFKIENTEQDAEYINTFINNTETKYRFNLIFTNGLHIDMLYSSIDAAIKDRNYIIDYLIKYYDEKE